MKSFPDNWQQKLRKSFAKSDSLNSLDYLKWFKENKKKSNVVHHLKAIGQGRKRSRALIEHYSVVDLSVIEHSEIHQIGLTAFEKKHNRNLWREAWRSLARWVDENPI